MIEQLSQGWPTPMAGFPLGDPAIPQGNKQNRMKYIGVLALQGAFAKHIDSCKRLGAEAKEFRDVEELGNLSALIIPGGESTTIGMLLERRGLLEPLKIAILAGLPVFGTCAGAILLAKNIAGSTQLRLGTMDIEIERNAYGSQVDSFEATLDISYPESPTNHEFEGVFIRAPRIASVDKNVTVLGSFGGDAVLVRQKNMLAASFHPELTADSSIHRYFLEYVAKLTLKK